MPQYLEVDMIRMFHDQKAQSLQMVIKFHELNHLKGQYIQSNNVGSFASFAFFSYCFSYGRPDFVFWQFHIQNPKEKRNTELNKNRNLNYR